MEKDITKEAIQQSVYEMKGQLNLTHSLLKNRLQRIDTLLFFLVVIIGIAVFHFW